MSDQPGPGHNSNRFMQLMQHATELQAQLQSEGYTDEDVLGALESETQVLDLLDRTIERMVADQRLAASAKERAKRLEARAENRKSLMDFIMKALRRDNIERPLGTVYYQKNPTTLQITGPVPAKFRVQVEVDDKDSIKKALEAGERVENCALSPDKYHLRVKVT